MWAMSSMLARARFHSSLLAFSAFIRIEATVNWFSVRPSNGITKLFMNALAARPSHSSMVEPVTVIALSSTLIGWGSPWIGSVNALEHSASMHVVTDWIGPSKSPGSGSTRKSLNSEWISLNFISVSQTVLRSTSSVIIGWPLIGSVGA